MAPPSPHQVLVIKTKTTDDSGAKRESDSTFTFEKKIQSLLSSSPLLLQILPGVEKILNVPAQTVLRPHDPIKACRGRVTQGLVIKKRGRSKLGHPTFFNCIFHQHILGWKFDPNTLQIYVYAKSYLLLAKDQARKCS